MQAADNAYTYGHLTSFVAAQRRQGEDFLVSRGSRRDLGARMGQVRALAIDFDETLIVGNHWALVEALFPRKILQEADVERAKFYADRPDRLAARYTHVDDKGAWLHESHTPQDARCIEDWHYIFHAVDRMRRSGITRQKLESLAADLRLRNGAEELNGLMSRTLVISFGIEQLIAEFLKLRMPSPFVASNRLIFDARGVACGLTGTPVIPATKGAILRWWCQCLGIDLHTVLVVGDSYSDAEMMLPETVNVLLQTSHTNGDGIDEYRASYIEDMYPRLDAVLYSDTLLMLVGLIQGCRK